jgi:cation diffusion facilitator family transporter
MFPRPLKPPQSIDKAREDRISTLINCVTIGIGIRVLIIVIEAIGFLYFGSSSLFMDALSTSLDICSSMILLLFIKLAAKPPDIDHPFGHGRYEPLAGMQLGVLLVVLGIIMIIQQSFELSQNIVMRQEPGFLWIIPLMAVIMLELAYRYIRYHAKKQTSTALYAEAIHFRTDAMTSFLATVALGLGSFLKDYAPLLDKLGAIGIGLIMAVLGLVAAKKNLNQLMDKVPEIGLFLKVKEAALKAQGVLGTEKIRIQQYGPDAHVDIDVEVDPYLSVEEAHKISQCVRLEIQKDWPSVQDVIVHIEPYYKGDH